MGMVEIITGISLIAIAIAVTPVARVLILAIAGTVAVAAIVAVGITAASILIQLRPKVPVVVVDTAPIPAADAETQGRRALMGRALTAVREAEKAGTKRERPGLDPGPLPSPRR